MGEAQQRGTVRVRIFLFIIRKAHGQAWTDYFLRGEEIKDNMYPVNIFILLHETNTVYLSFTNEFTLSLLILFYERIIRQFLVFASTVTESIYPMDLKLGR